MIDWQPPLRSLRPTFRRRALRAARDFVLALLAFGLLLLCGFLAFQQATS